MRHLIDTYIRADESKNISAFDSLSLIRLIVDRGAEAVSVLLDGIRTNREAVALGIGIVTVLQAAVLAGLQDVHWKWRPPLCEQGRSECGPLQRRCADRNEQYAYVP